MYRFFFKRFFDIVLSSLGILVLAVPMLIIAIIIKCDSRGPAIFTQFRVGKNGKNFRFYKFRSMRVTAPKDCATRLLESDNYITKVGKVIRKTSLDELPQLFCIFVGNMSIIGPRPVVTSETDLIEARKLTGAYKVKAGLTGLAQISGRDEIIDMKYKASLDGKYAKKITFLGDAKIFLKTIGKVFKRDGVVEGEKVLQQSAALKPAQPEAAQPDTAPLKSAQADFAVLDKSINNQITEISTQQSSLEPTKNKKSFASLQELDMQSSERHTA